MTVICKNCKYYKNNLIFEPDCKHPKTIIIDLVKGKKYYRYCYNVRHNSMFCDIDGKLFEPK